MQRVVLLIQWKWVFLLCVLTCLENWEKARFSTDPCVTRLWYSAKFSHHLHKAWGGRPSWKVQHRHTGMQACCGSEDNGLCLELGGSRVTARDGLSTLSDSPHGSSTVPLGTSANQILHFIPKHIHWNFETEIFKSHSRCFTRAALACTYRCTHFQTERETKWGRQD